MSEMNLFEKELEFSYLKGRGDIYTDGGLIFVTVASGKKDDRYYLQFRINGKRISRAEAERLFYLYVENDKRRREGLMRPFK